MANISNLTAFLDMIAWSEIGQELLDLSEDGYNVCVGSTPKHPILFHDYSTHPRIHNKATNSDAAGRYQFMGRYWIHYRNLLRLPDFGPSSQDKWAIRLIREARAYDDLISGRFERTVSRCAHLWASLPGNNYGQHVNELDKLQLAYTNAGGIIA